MPVCGSCGATRLEPWKVCPFCRAHLAPDAPVAEHVVEPEVEIAAAPTGPVAHADPPPPTAADATPPPPTAADASTPQPSAEDPPAGDTDPLLDAADDTDPTTDSSPAPAESKPVPPKVLAALAAVAAVIVGFLGWSVVTEDHRDSDDIVAFVDLSTTTSMLPTTTAAPVTVVEPTPTLSDDLVTQAQAICQGEQTSIAGAESPTTATYNDLITVRRSGESDWATDQAQTLFRGEVPSLIRCVDLQDGPVIHYCDDYTNDFTYTGRATAWSVRVLQTIDGTEIDSASGEAGDVPPCPPELSSFSDDRDIVERAVVDPSLIASVGQALTAAMNPAVACLADDAGSATFQGENPPSIEAVRWTDQDLLVPLPDEWAPSDDRPTLIGLCLVPQFVENDDNACTTEVFVVAKNADNHRLDEWSWSREGCEWGTEPPAPPIEWFRTTVGPDLGHPSA